MEDIVTLRGKTTHLMGELLAPGIEAPDFTFVGSDLIEKCLYDLDAKVKVILSLPSVDTGICALETKAFNQKLKGLKNVVIIAVSRDLPFALKRFCDAEEITNLHMGSDYRYREFGDEYNIEIIDGPLKGLLARSVMVLDANHKIQYAELVPEIASEPNYDAALKAIQAELGK
ncbi:MAG: thiol peroxidase [Sphingobacteriales bacterium]|jgi:thiol peroxidase